MTDRNIESFELGIQASIVEAERILTIIQESAKSTSTEAVMYKIATVGLETLIKNLKNHLSSL